MEVALPVSPPSPAADFHSNCSSPYMTAPSSPQRLANSFFSAPTSPSRSPVALYGGATASRKSTSSAPDFDWEEIPKAQRNRASQNGSDQDQIADEDFEFDFSGNLEWVSLSAADELFHGGKIRPLTPPAGGGSGSSVSPPRSKRTVSSGNKGPSAAAEIEETNRTQKPKQRGPSRSLSPIRVSDIVFKREEEEITPKPAAPSSIASIFSAASFGKRYRKWKLRDFLLFRSASEGRATGKEAIVKYAAMSSKKAVEEDLKNTSFRSTEGSELWRRRAPPVSAHEIHYTVNRAAAEELRRKTLLPYKRGLFGCLGFNHEISRGIGSLTRGRS